VQTIEHAKKASNPLCLMFLKSAVVMSLVKSLALS